jgi:hypothetical protein
MRSVLMVLGVALIPSLAAAQAPREEVAYCRELAHTYEHYIGRSEKSPDHDNRLGSLTLRWPPRSATAERPTQFAF